MTWLKFKVRHDGPFDQYFGLYVDSKCIAEWIYDPNLDKRREWAWRLLDPIELKIWTDLSKVAGWD